MKSVERDRGSKTSAMKKRATARRTKSRRRGNRRRKALGFSDLLENLQQMRIGDLYRPLKKRVTVRLDEDVIAWFQRDGRRYQTRVNAALRAVMEREVRTAG